MDGDGDLIWAFDPGRNIGFALVSAVGEPQRLEVLDREAVAGLDIPGEATIIVGDGTGSRDLEQLLAARGLSVVLVAEHGSTLEGRGLYWSSNPPRGLLRLLPPGLRPQPAGIDSYAAWALARRWLRNRQHSGNMGQEEGRHDSRPGIE